MNMKKTIAAISAAAVAVSAMATTVNAAFEAQTLTFNLAELAMTANMGTATYTVRFTTNVTGANLSLNLGALQTMTWYDLDFGDCVWTITSTDINGRKNTEVYSKKSGATSAYVTGTATATTLDLPEGTFAANTEVVASITVKHTYWNSYVDDGCAKAAIVITPKDTVGEVLVSEAIPAVPAVLYTQEEYDAAYDAAFDAAYEVAYEAALVSELQSALSSLLTDLDDLIDLATGSELSAAKTAAKTTVDNDANIAVTAANDVTFAVGDIKTPAVDAVEAVYEDGVVAGEVLVTSGTIVSNITDYSQSPSDVKFPMQTGLNGIYVYDSVGEKYTTDLIYYLSNWNLQNEWNPSPYTNVTAVLNDAAVNYDNISVTFYTAANSVKYVDASKMGSKYDGKWAYYADNADGTYTSFGQHLYNAYMGNTGYINYNWTDFNLFSGALVVNKTLTMSLSDVNSFTFGADHLTFSWNTVMDTNSKSAINPAAKFISRMDLITSTTWYWDRVEFVLENATADDTGAEAPIEADEDDLDDDADDIEEDDTDADEDDDDADVDTDEDDADEDDDTDVAVDTEVAPVENVKTGNASVALAVIPVALAAAAIVAKKRS